MFSLSVKYTRVEKPFIRRSQRIGWQYSEGDIDDPYLTERENFRQVRM